MDIRSYIRSIPDYPKPGILFHDITPLLNNSDAFKYTIDALYAATKDMKPTKIVAADARGFIFAAPLALQFNVGFVPIRKPGKLPYKTISASYTLEYGSNTLCMHEDALSPQDRVLIVDDILATGGTAEAMLHLVSQCGAKTVGCAMIIELVSLAGREKIKDVPLKVLMKFD